MAWLASELARRERPLRAGDVVLSEAIGPMVPVNPGDAFEANVGGLRTVSARFRLENRHLYGSPISPACNASEEASNVAAATFMIDRFRRSLIV
jgi:hypothetical protein